MRKIIGLVALLLMVNLLSAQSWEVLKQNEQAVAKYKWKESKEGEMELRIKFKNTSKSDLNVDFEIGFYADGVLEESSEIATCLKKGFLKNWFRNWHVIQSETDKKLDEMELEAIELKTEKVDECTETDA